MKKLWYKNAGLIDLGRLSQTSPNILLFSLFANRSSSSAAKIRYYHAKIFWKKLPSYGIRNTIFISSYFLLWPYSFLKAIRKLGIDPYRKVRRLTGKAIIQQFIEQIYLAFFYSSSPKEYFMYEFFKLENRKRIDKYLLRLTLKPLIYSFLDECYMGKNNLNYINNHDSKEFFYNVCKKYELNAVPILAKVTSEKVFFFVDLRQIRESGDLFIKPEESKGGKGAQMWRKQDNYYVNTFGETKDFDSLIEYIKGIKSNRFSNDFIIQPRVVNHQKLFFDTIALSTIRINTLLVNEIVMVTFGVFRFSLNKNSDVDNFHAGGYAAPIVDMETGELGPASGMGFSNPGHWIDMHPISGTQINGLNLPYWNETKELVSRSHKLAFNNRVLLGWDVAITDNGPILVECNGWPDNELIQKPYNRPLSELFGLDVLAQKIEDEYLEYCKA